MDIIDFYYILLGIIQGTTEFLPISSSGHLQLMSHLGFSTVESESNNLFITIILHLATALSIIFIFHQKIKEIIFFRSSDDSFSYILKIIIALIPAVVIGLLFEEKIEYLFSKNDSFFLSFMFLITGLILCFTNSIKENKKSLTYKIVFLIGCAQAFAIFPGISRSGITICVALFLGLKKSEATSFSFIIFLPLIFGKILKDLFFDYSELKSELLELNIFSLLIAFLVTFFIGLLCCRLMIKIVERNNLINFGYYCIGLALFLMFLSLC